MRKKPCPIELLITTQYCQLSVCNECKIVNLSLPGRITFQFEIQQFIEVAHAINKSARILITKKQKERRATIFKLDNLH